MPIVTSGLTHYYNSKDGVQSGNVLNNLAPSGTGTAAITGGTYMPGDGSLHLNGGTDRLTLPTIPYLATKGQAQTVEIVFKLENALTEGYQELWGAAGYQAYGDLDLSGGFYSNFLYVYHGDGVGSADYYNVPAPEFQTIQTLTVTHVIQGKQLISYVNGTEKLNQTSGTNYSFTGTAEPLVINGGLNEPKKTLYFKAIRTYNRALTPTEINWNAQEGDNIGLDTPDGSALAVLSNLSPANNKISSDDVELLSATVTDADGDANTVYLEVSKTQDFAALTHALSVPNVADGNTASFNLTGLDQGNYYWRMRAKKAGTSTYTAYTAYRGLFVDTVVSSGFLPPESLITLTGASGSVTAIQDDPDAPDGNWLTASGGSDVIAHVAFATPPGTVKAGTNLQHFRALVRKTDKTTPDNGSVTLSLYENGTYKAQQTFSLGNTDTKFSFYWDAALLTDSTGAGVELRVTGVGVYAGPGKNRFAVDIGAVDWIYDVEGETQDPAPGTNVEPSVTVTSISRSVLSPVAGMDTSTVRFTFSEDVVQWTARLDGVSYDTGTEVGSGGAVTQGVEAELVITYTQLTTEGNNRINLYGLDGEGAWTLYDS